MEKSVFERLLSLETPVYYYDMDLLKDTVDSLAETAAAHGVKVHYAVKSNNGARTVFPEMKSPGPSIVVSPLNRSSMPVSERRTRN